MNLRSVGLCVFACVALLSPQAALAQQRTPTPSGDELWRTYPLHTTPRHDTEPTGETSPSPASSGGRPGSGQPGARSRGDGRDGSISLRWVVALVVPGLLALLWIVRLGRKVPSHTPAASGAHTAVPPDPHRAWTAEIQWSRTGDDSRFRVVARGAQDDAGSVVAESSPLHWPPADVTAVAAVSAAADELAESLIAAGWQPLPRSGAWYARRFVWTPAQHAGEFWRGSEVGQ